MNLAELLRFVPLIIGLALAWHLIFKKDLLASKSILGVLAYLVGIIIVLFAISWLIRSLLPGWSLGLLNTGTNSAEWQRVIDTSSNIFDNAFTESGSTTVIVQPTAVQVQVETVVVTATPGPGVGFGTSDGDGNGRTGPTQYTVQAGDTLTRIAKHYGVTVHDIMRANNIMNPNYIQPGQVLNIPAPGQ
jgi:LysM repeat protein